LVFYALRAGRSPISCFQHLPGFSQDVALPGFTRFVLAPHTWLLFAPWPWAIGAAVLSFRRQLSPDALFIFAGSIVLGMVVVLCAVTIAAILPLIPIRA
jgi:hypothetical protein